MKYHIHILTVSTFSRRFYNYQSTLALHDLMPVFKKLMLRVSMFSEHVLSLALQLRFSEWR
jgi:hypothetical protein